MRLAELIRKVLRVHDGSEFTADEFPTLAEGREATAALDVLEANLEIRERQVTYLLREQERGRIFAAAVEQRERKVERLIAAGDVLAAMFWWRNADKERWRAAVADLQADSQPPIARDPVQDAPRRFWT